MVDVPYTFEDKFYPIKGLENETCGKTDEDVKAVTATLSGELLEREFTCRYETLKFTRGKQLLDSETALKFVRSRHSDTNGNDFGRSLRQQAFLIGIKNKLLSFSGFTKTFQIANELSKNLMTDINIGDAFGLIEDTGLQDVTIKTISLNTDNVLMESVSSNRQYILVTKEGEGNFTELQKYIKQNLEELKKENGETD
jgi:anionic cell wall polymer biosynthesis LytR-Cps2A-Psr (LCP) family protein